ncbi:MAG: flagellar basal-body rod protein FlgF [Candidatus Tectimicrobiota bacterium]|nr:MAG: flagellar basal-body rod protein FlgF [Candidatus Tectomicrobia bacterium]
MNTGLYAAVSGALAQEQRLAVLTNNLANLATVGFKADQPLFATLALPVVVGPVSLPEGSPPVVTSLDPWLGLTSPQHQVHRVVTDFSQGPLRDTGNPLDVALEGPGFFAVDAPFGVAYTRQGTFSLDAEGFLVTSSGWRVRGELGPIRVQGQRVEIDATGQVVVDGTVVDRLQLVDFPQPYALRKVGAALFVPSQEPPPASVPARPVVHQGAVELANTDPLRLLGAVLQAARAYEAYQKVIQAFDDTTGRAVNDLAATA